MSDTDFAALIEDVARHFWGDPNPKLSSKTELRWGGQGSRAVFLDGPGNWKDFEADIGGGVIDLVKAERKCSKAEAIEWLEGENYIAKRDSERRDGPQRQEQPRASNEPEAREHELHRIVTDAGRKLQNNGYIDRDNTKGIVWWTGKTDRPLFKPKAVEPEPAGTGVAPAAREEIKQMAMDEVPF